MNKEFKDKIKGILVIPIGLAVILVPFSLLIGWNLISLFVFWFLLTPGLAIYLPTKFSSNGFHLFKSFAGLVIFYSMMVFMIYDHYKTDYFKIMILSFAINLMLGSLIIWALRSKTLTQKNDEYN